MSQHAPAPANYACLVDACHPGRPSASVDSVRSLNLELMTLSSEIVSAHALLCRAWIPSPRVPRLYPDWGEPGRRDRHDQDSHVTSNTPPRSNTGSVIIGHAEGTCDCASCNCIVLHLQVRCIVFYVCCNNMQVGSASSKVGPF
jgi:hypothetical protein